MRETSMPIWAQICKLKSLWKLTAGVRRAKGPASQQRLVSVAHEGTRTSLFPQWRHQLTVKLDRICIKKVIQIV